MSGRRSRSAKVMVTSRCTMPWIAAARSPGRPGERARQCRPVETLIRSNKRAETRDVEVAARGKRRRGNDGPGNRMAARVAAMLCSSIRFLGQRPERGGGCRRTAREQEPLAGATLRLWAEAASGAVCVGSNPTGGAHLVAAETASDQVLWGFGCRARSATFRQGTPDPTASATGGRPGPVVSGRLPFSVLLAESGAGWRPCG